MLMEFPFSIFVLSQAVCPNFRGLLKYFEQMVSLFSTQDLINPGNVPSQLKTNDD